MVQPRWRNIKNVGKPINPRPEAFSVNGVNGARFNYDTLRDIEAGTRLAGYGPRLRQAIDQAKERARR